MEFGGVMTLQALEGVNQPCGCNRVIKVAPFYWRLDTHSYLFFVVPAEAWHWALHGTISAALPWGHNKLLLPKMWIPAILFETKPIILLIEDKI